MHPPAGCPVTPGAPAILLLPHIAGARPASQRHSLGPLTAVILGVVVGTKLETVVGAADEVTLAASVTVIVTSITRTITVTLTLVTRILRSAASLTVIISSGTSLTCRGLQRHTSRDQRKRLRDGQSLWKVAAVILLVEVCSELLAVVAATHQVSLAAPVTIISSSIQRTVTVTLAVAAGALWCTAPATIEVTASTSLALRGLCQWSTRGTLSLTKSKSCENCQ